MSLLGIDVGSTGCKAAAFAESGACLGSAYREYPTLQPGPGLAELDSQAVWGQIKDAIAEVVARTKGNPVSALCACSMGEAMIPVAADGRLLAHSIMSSDVRGAETVAELRAKLGQREFYRLNPNILGTNYSLPKLRWIRDHQRALYDQTWKFLFWGDLVAFLLAGKPQTSRSYANRTLLFDIRRERWSEPLLALGGIAREKLPDIVADGAVVGTVAAAMAKELGLPAGVQVVAGGHDQGYNSLGAGIYQAGKAVCGIGSYECITPTYAGIPDDVDAMLAQGLNIEHHVIPGLYVSFIYNQAGMLVKWFRDTFAPGAEGAGLYDALAAEMPVAPTRLMTLPYFETTGSPEFVSDAAGVIAGLKTSHRRGDILKSIMESSTYYFVDSLAALKAMGMDTSEFVATGGGARSDPWLQIKADILGVPFVRPRITECTVLGAAMLAGLGTKRFASPAEAVARFVQRDRVFTPDPGRHAIYVEQVEKYRRLFPLLREYLRGL